MVKTEATIFSTLGDGRWFAKFFPAFPDGAIQPNSAVVNLPRFLAADWFGPHLAGSANLTPDKGCSKLTIPLKCKTHAGRRFMAAKRVTWAASGDVNAFFGLMLDNIADLLLAVSLLKIVCNFPEEFALRYMVPGIAIGVLVGDLLFFFMALRLARTTQRDNVTSMPLGIDTPSTFGMVLFVLAPAFTAARNRGLAEFDAALYTWQIGICSIFISGLFKFACTYGSGSLRRIIPRAGLLGSLAAVALVLISFLPLLETLHYPVVGLVGLAIILTTLVARVPLPFRVPGALGGLLVAGSLYYGMQAGGLLGHAAGAESMTDPTLGLLPYEWLRAFRFEWLGVFGDSLNYLPIVLPMALATVVGGIDCTESAAAVGDDYDTREVIAVEAFATVVASLCGGVIQTTPYIGHPAYKAMGGRAAYTLATALFVGSAGLLGYFGYLYLFVPKATVFPILVFVGLEITAQSFLATPKRHYPAVALACVPALAALAIIFVNKLMGPNDLDQAPVFLQHELVTLRILSSGFIVTSLLWAAALASLIDRRLFRAAGFMATAGCCALVGVIHSPLRESPLILPWRIRGENPSLPEGFENLPYEYGAGYLLTAILFVAWGAWLRSRGDRPLNSDEEFVT